MIGKQNFMKRLIQKHCSLHIRLFVIVGRPIYSESVLFYYSIIQVHWEKSRVLNYALKQTALRFHQNPIQSLWFFFTINYTGRLIGGSRRQIRISNPALTTVRWQITDLSTPRLTWCCLRIHVSLKNRRETRYT